jgi:hypothetical protein
MVGHAFLDTGEAPYQGFACRAVKLVLLRVVDEVGLVESAVRFSAMSIVIPTEKKVGATLESGAEYVQTVLPSRLHSILGDLPSSVYQRNMAAKEPIVVSEIT